MAVSHFAREVRAHEDADRDVERLVEDVANQLNSSRWDNIKAFDKRDAVGIVFQLALKRNQGPLDKLMWDYNDQDVGRSCGFDNVGDCNYVFRELTA